MCWHGADSTNRSTKLAVGNAARTLESVSTSAAAMMRRALSALCSSESVTSSSTKDQSLSTSSPSGSEEAAGRACGEEGEERAETNGLEGRRKPRRFGVWDKVRDGGELRVRRKRGSVEEPKTERRTMARVLEVATAYRDAIRQMSKDLAKRFVLQRKH